MHKNILEECKSKRSRHELQNQHEGKMQQGSSSIKIEPSSFKQKMHISSLVETKSPAEDSSKKDFTKESDRTVMAERSVIVAECHPNNTQLRPNGQIKPTPDQQPNPGIESNQFLGKRTLQFDTAILPVSIIQPFKVPQNLNREQSDDPTTIPYSRVISPMRPITIGPSSSNPRLRDQPLSVQPSEFAFPDGGHQKEKPTISPKIQPLGQNYASLLKIQPLVLTPNPQSQFLVPKATQARMITPQVDPHPRTHQQASLEILYTNQSSQPSFSENKSEGAKPIQTKVFKGKHDGQNLPGPSNHYLPTPTQLFRGSIPSEQLPQRAYHQLQQHILRSKMTETLLPNSLRADEEVDGPTYFRFEAHLEQLCRQLCGLLPRPNVKPPVLSQREAVYSAVSKLVANFKLVPVNAELLVRKKVGRYFGLLHALLRDINDQESDLYSQLFMETGLLLKQLRSLAITFVDALVLLSTNSVIKILFQPPTL